MTQFSNLTKIVKTIQEKYQNPTAFNFYQNDELFSFSSSEFARNIQYLALGLNDLGLGVKMGFSIIAKPSPIWLMIDFAVFANRAVSVPIFADISPTNLLFEIADAKIEFVFCDSLENLQIVQSSGVGFKKIITFGFALEGENIVSFENLLEKGRLIFKNNPGLFDFLTSQVQENDLATIVYTSGSTGVPKGVEITHKNLCSQINSLGKCFNLNQSDVALSFLPLAHIFERMVALLYISKNVSIYFAPDIKNMGNLLMEIKPTLMTAVPRVLEKVFAKMKNKVDESGFLKKFIGNKAFAWALEYDHHKCRYSPFSALNNFIFNCLVYKKLRSSLGGNLRMIICGGAPLSLDIAKFFWGIGVNLYVGYGTTESSPVISVNFEHNQKIGTVGRAIEGVEVKIDEFGELLAKGDNIMAGYHNNPQKTSETIIDGWLKTGDLATIDEEGFIKIIGRRKEMFKTAGGKYVSPVPIEQNLLRHFGLLSEACIIAEGRKFVSCLLFLDFEILAKYKTKIKLQNLSDEQFLKSDFLKNRLDKLIEDVNQNLNHWEQIQKYQLIHQPLSIQSGELTPSMKLRRHFVEEKYSDIIDNFYLDSES